MAVTINASTSAGLVNTADTSGVLALQTSGTTAVSISAGQVATFAQAPVLPAASIPQAALAAGVAGNGPAFSAYASSSQSITASTFTLLQNNTEVFDTASCFNNTGSTVGGIPAYAFLPNVAGYYQVNASYYLPSAATGQQIISLYKNGSNYVTASYALTSTTAIQPIFTYLIYLNGTSDYIQFYVYQSSSGALSTIASRPDLNFFQAALVRSA